MLQGRFTYPRIRDGSRRGGDYTSTGTFQQQQQFSPTSGGSERSLSTSRSSSGLGAFSLDSFFSLVIGPTFSLECFSRTALTPFSSDSLISFR